MDHQKLNILLIFCTFSFGGCGGQGCYFWPNPRVIRKNSTIQDSQNTFKPSLACIFLPIRAKWSIQVCVETPCTSFFQKSPPSTFILTSIFWDFATLAPPPCLFQPPRLLKRWKYKNCPCYYQLLRLLGPNWPPLSYKTKNRVVLSFLKTSFERQKKDSGKREKWF